VEIAADGSERAILVSAKEHAMLNLYLALRDLWADTRGVTAIEYAVLAGAVAVGLAAVFASDGDVFTPLTDAITDALGESPAGGSGDS
jgi:pilus assembly protein Flp/PilA